MGTYILKRLLMLIPMTFGISIITFSIIALSPYKVAEEQMGEYGAISSDKKATSSKMQHMRSTFGEEYPDNSPFSQYYHWLKRVLTEGSFGESLDDGKPVTDKIVSTIPVSMFFNIASLLIVYLIAIPIGIYSATHKDSRVDTSMTFVLYLLYSLPGFWVAILLIKLDSMLGYPLPFQGIHPQGASGMTTIEMYYKSIPHIILPIICMVYGAFAGMSRYMRASMIDVVNMDYIRTARAKGLSERLVIFKHALKNSLIPMVTMIAGILPGMIGGSVILEKIFNIPGMGRLGYMAVAAKDLPVIMALTTFAAILVMLGILISDILYAVVDPRISFGGKSE
ncbi:MAG: ABC transporter permease [Planctomycetota bacterium]